MTDRKAELGPGVGLFVLLGLTGFIYWPGLAGGGMLDDFANLMPLSRMGTGGYSWQEVVTSGSSFLGRPVSFLTFVGNYVTSGGTFWSFKYTNLMLHLLTGSLLFWLTGRLLSEPRLGVRPHHWWLALWVAAAWLMAPLFVSTVLYTIQRMAQLSALFVAAGLLCYVAGRQNLERHFARGASLIVIAFVVFWPLAVLSKENGALLPVLALLVEVAFFEFAGSRTARRLLVGVFTITVAVPALCAAVWAIAHQTWLMNTNYGLREFTLVERLLTQARILLEYVQQLVFPRGATMGIYHDDYLPSEGLLSPPTTLLAIVGWSLVLIVAWWKRRTRVRWLLFGPLFFLAAHSIESSIFPLELYFEHRNYLPGYGIFFAIALGGWYLGQRLPSRQVVAAVLVLLPAAYAAASYQRVQVWRSPETILLTSAETHPRSPRVHIELASVYANAGRLDTALEELNRADALLADARSSGVAVHRLLVYCASKTSPPGEAYERLRELPGFHNDTYTINALMLLTERVEAGRCPWLDVPQIATAVDALVRRDTKPDTRGWWKFHVAAAKLLDRVKRKADALEHLNMATRLYPESVVTRLLAFRIQLGLGDIDGARATLEELKRRDARGRTAHTQTIDFYAQLLERVEEVRTNVAKDLPPHDAP